MEKYLPVACLRRKALIKNVEVSADTEFTTMLLNSIFFTKLLNDGWIDRKTFDKTF